MTRAVKVGAVAAQSPRHEKNTPPPSSVSARKGKLVGK